MSCDQKRLFMYEAYSPSSYIKKAHQFANDYIICKFIESCWCIDKIVVHRLKPGLGGQIVSALEFSQSRGLEINTSLQMHFTPKEL